MDWLDAEEAIDDPGLGYLSGQFELRRDDGSWVRVLVVDVSPGGIRVKEDDGGAVDARLAVYSVEVPVSPERLRPL